MNPGELVNQLLQAISEFNEEEAAYWCRTLLNHISKHKETLQSIPIGQLIPGFFLGDHELSRLLAQLIMEIVCNEDFAVVIERYGSELQNGFTYESYPVLQELCIDIVMKVGLSQGNVVPESLIAAALKCMYSTNASASNRVIENLKLIKAEAIESVLLTLNRPSESVAQFRYMEALSIVGQAGESEKVFKSFIGELNVLLEKGDDPLLLSNVIFTISECIKNHQQYVLFQQHGIIGKVFSFLNHQNNTIVSRTVSFFAECAINDCFQIGDEGFSFKLRELVESEDLDVRKAAVFAVCALASKDALFESVKSLMGAVIEGLIHGHSSIQISALHGIGIIFQNMTEKKLEFLNSLNSALSQSIFSWLGSLALSNFDEQKSAAYFALRGLLSSRDGLKLAMDSSSILTDLLDRERDISLSGLKWKYGILEMISKGSDLFGLLNQPLQQQLMRYLGQGVVFKATSTRVAFESAN